MQRNEWKNKNKNNDKLHTYRCFRFVLAFYISRCYMLNFPFTSQHITPLFSNYIASIYLQAASAAEAPSAVAVVI